MDSTVKRRLWLAALGAVGFAAPVIITNVMATPADPAEVIARLRADAAQHACSLADQGAGTWEAATIAADATAGLVEAWRVTLHAHDLCSDRHTWFPVGDWTTRVGPSQVCARSGEVTTCEVSQ